LQRETEESVSAKWFPTKGFMIRLNQKKPKLEIFTSMFEPTNGYMMFANKKPNGEVNILSVLKIHCEKDKKI
jgi:hypothetical protein